MTKTTKLLLAAGATAISVAGAAPAYAAGTTAGSNIVNNVTVNYNVGTVAQTAINASNSFVVDRKVTLTVAPVGTTTTLVSPGQNAAITTFTVTNTSNAILDLGLALAQQTGSTAPHNGTDNFDVTTPTMYVDTNTNGSYDVGTDLAVTYLDEVAADGSRTVFVVANIPIGRATSDVAAVTLTAQARDGGGANAQGTVVTETSGANTALMDTVFADTQGATDAARDGRFSASNDYTVSAAALTVLKTATVISDPLNGTTNPKMIPGATVAYCIQVTNAAGGATATGVAISDPVPTQMTYDAGYGVLVNGTVAGGICAADANAAGTFASGIVTGTIASVAAGATRTVYFRTTIN